MASSTPPPAAITGSVPAESITKSVLGSLTTAYEPPPECSTYLWVGSGDALTEFQYGATCEASGTSWDVIEATSCYPPDFIKWRTENSVNEESYATLGVYSPGLECPAGFHEACSYVRTADSEATASNRGRYLEVNALQVGETLVGCCRSGWKCNADFAMNCQLDITASTRILATSYTTDCDVTTYTEEITTPTVYIGEDYRINMIKPRTDVEQSPDSSESGGLTTGAKIGIGVGVPLAVIAIALIAFIAFKRRHNKKIGPQPEIKGGVSSLPIPVSQDMKYHNSPQLPYNSQYHGQPGPDTQGYTYSPVPPVQELGAYEVPPELPTSSNTYELPPETAGTGRIH